MPTTFGPSFESELAAADLLGLPFVWYQDGSLEYGDELSASERAALDAVAAAHDPDAAAPPIVPESVTKYQCCVVLARHGLLVPANEFFAAMTGDAPHRLAWEMAGTVWRRSASTLAAIDALALTVEQADALFIEAAQVT